MEAKQYKCPACNNTTHNILLTEGITAIYCPFCQNKILAEEIK